MRFKPKHNAMSGITHPEIDRLLISHTHFIRMHNGMTHTHTLTRQMGRTKKHLPLIENISRANGALQRAGPSRTHRKNLKLK